MDERGIRELLAAAPAPDVAARSAVRRRAAEALRPAGALAAMDDVAEWLAGWQRTARPAVDAPVALVFAGDHGVVHRGVTAYPPEVTAAVVEAIDKGAATAPVLAGLFGVRLRVVDVGVGRPTGDLVEESSLDPARFAESFEAGRAAVREEACDLLVLGEVGMGNTTAASAVAATLFGGPAGGWTGPGAGLSGERLAAKVAVVEEARARVGTASPLEVLRQLGGAELVALAGAIVEARVRGIGVLLDGFVVAAAAAPLAAIDPAGLDHCLAGHRSGEPGHDLLLRRLGLSPVLDLGLRLGEGSGALLAVPIVRAACAAVTEVATFDEWGLER